MSRTNNLVGRLRPRSRQLDGADGFTLVEVLVALTIFALVSSAAVSMFVTGLKASVVSKLDTGAKSLTQERIEIMRNLTYHIGYQPTGFNPPDFLDSYYRNLTAAGTIVGGVAPAGYVSAGQTGSTYRLPDEPATGAFYRFALNPVPDFPKYKQYVATQFLTTTGTPVTPGTGYNSQAQSPADDPPASAVGVTVVTQWFAGDLSKSYRIYTRLNDGQPAATQVSVQGRIAAVHIQTGIATDTQLVVEAGVLGLDGATSTGAGASATAVGASAALAPGDRIEGASGGVTVPPAGSEVNLSASSEELEDPDGNDVAAFAETEVSDVFAQLADGMPQAGTVADPVTSVLDDGGLGAYSLKVWNNPDPPTRLQLDLSQPQVAIHGGSGVAVTSTGYVATSAVPATHGVDAVLTAATRRLRVLPTSFAPEGIIRVRLDSATVECHSGVTGTSVTGDYEATVEYMTYSALSGYAYETLTVKPGGDSLTDAQLDTQVGVDPLTGEALVLRDYVTSWSNVPDVSAAGEEFNDGKGVQMSTAGLVSIQTVPTRTDADDPGTSLDESNPQVSTIALQLGAFTCLAEDNQ